MQWFWYVLIGLVAVLLIAYFSWQAWAMKNVKSPAYKVISSAGSIEIRQYQPLLIAEVEVKGSRKEAISAGFRQLAGFIFGNNIAANQQAEKIAMTTPVMQQASGSEKIAMTSPVLQQLTANKTWLVRFVMPKKYSLKTLPKPANANIKIIEVPAEKKVVIRFSGAITSDSLIEHEKQLQAYIKENKLSVEGEPDYAFYNPPWTLPQQRRNEVMFTLR